MQKEIDNITIMVSIITSWIKGVFMFIFLIILLFHNQHILHAQNLPMKKGRSDLPKSIVIDFNNDYAQITYNQASKALFLSEIAFIGSSESKNNFAGMPQMSANEIGALEIESFSENDILAIQKTFLNTGTINRLIIKNSQIQSIPIDFIIDHNVKEFYIENCRTIDPNSLNQLLARENNLFKLTVSDCGIYKLNIETTSNNIRILDLSNNKLASVASFLSYFPKLDSLFIDGNNIPDTEYELENCAKSNLKYIRADSVSPAFKSYIKQINNLISWDFGPMSESVKKRLNHYGDFSIGNQDYQVFSPAYLQYNQIFSNRLLRVDFDTLFVEEKFWDTITTLSRVSTFNQSVFRLFRHKGLLRGHITFNFYPRRNNKSRIYSSNKFFKNHEELSIFRDYRWVTSGAIKSKEFAPLTKINYIEIRLKYNPSTKTYTIYLKESTGKITTIEALPIKRKMGKSSEIASNDLESDYAKYLSVLARKTRKADKETIKTKRQIRNSLAQLERNSWQLLRSTMSPEERLMTEEAWMNYYVKILSNEAKALESCFPSDIYWIRSLNLLGYSMLSNVNDTNDTEIKNVVFADENGSNIPVKEIYVLNHKSQTYRNYRFTTTIQAISLGLKKDEDISMIVILPDNSYGLIARNEVSFGKNATKNFKLKAQITKYDLITIGQIIDYLNL
jgi:hypothetical protein